MFEWPRFCHDVYLPAVVAHARVRQAGPRRQRQGPSGLTREERARQAVLSPDRQLAVFDLENTLVATNVVDSYAWFATRRMDLPERARFTVRTLLEAPRMLSLDMVDRGDFLRWFYRRYENADLAEASRGLLGAHQRPAPGQVVPGRDPAGPRAPRARPPDPAHHRGAGLRDRAVPHPLRRRRLRPHGRGDGELSGELDEAPPTGEARALIMADYAREHGLDLAECVAYADSTSDLPMLEAAGYPVAVNPETKLAALARKRGWLVEQWPRAAGYRRALLPFGPRLSQNQAPSGLREIMKALQVERSLPRFAMARIASEWRAGAGGRFGPLRLVDVAPPALPGPGWQRLLPRLTGICGSDLATVDGRSSRWFEPIVSFPFVPGHEVVADTEDGRRAS